jgi:hypothetical protein
MLAYYLIISVYSHNAKLQEYERKTLNPDVLKFNKYISQAITLI